MGEPATIFSTDFEAVYEGQVDDRNRLVMTPALDALRDRFPGENLQGVHFTCAVSSAGQVLLTPTTTIPLHEAWLHRNRTALTDVREGLAQAGRGELEPAPSFAEYADDELDG